HDLPFPLPGPRRPPLKIWDAPGGSHWGTPNSSPRRGHTQPGAAAAGPRHARGAPTNRHALIERTVRRDPHARRSRSVAIRLTIGRGPARPHSLEPPPPPVTVPPPRWRRHPWP